MEQIAAGIEEIVFVGAGVDDGAVERDLAVGADWPGLDGGLDVVGETGEDGAARNGSAIVVMNGEHKGKLGSAGGFIGDGDGRPLV